MVKRLVIDVIYAGEAGFKGISYGPLRALIDDMRRRVSISSSSGLPAFRDSDVGM